jgi:hypothetical protein
MTSLLLLAAGAACGRAPGRPAQREATIPPGLTAEQLYRSVEQAVADHKTDVLHAVVVLEDLTINSATPFAIPTSSPDSRKGPPAEQKWMDIATDAVRSEYRRRSAGEPADHVDIEIQRAGKGYAVDQRGNSVAYAAPACTGSSFTVVAVLLGCSLVDVTASIESGEQDGKPAILLVILAKSREDSTWVYSKHTTFVDPTTYLPLRVIERRSSTDPAVQTYYQSMTRRYEMTFVKRASLTNDFFDPASIGYVATAPVPADNLQRDVLGMRVYWIGSDFDAGLSGSLVLKRAVVYPGERSPGARATLSYNIRDDKSFYRGFGIREYPIALGEQLKSDIYGEWGTHGGNLEQVSIHGRRAELRSIGDSRYGDLLMIRIDFETTIVVVSDYLGAPPYTGRDAMLRIANALRPYGD